MVNMPHEKSSYQMHGALPHKGQQVWEKFTEVFEKIWVGINGIFYWFRWSSYL